MVKIPRCAGRSNSGVFNCFKVHSALGLNIYKLRGFVFRYSFLRHGYDRKFFQEEVGEGWTKS